MSLLSASDEFLFETRVSSLRQALWGSFKPSSKGTHSWREPTNEALSLHAASKTAVCCGFARCALENWLKWNVPVHGGCQTTLFTLLMTQPYYTANYKKGNYHPASWLTTRIPAKALKFFTRSSSVVTTKAMNWNKAEVYIHDTHSTSNPHQTAFTKRTATKTHQPGKWAFSLFCTVIFSWDTSHEWATLQFFSYTHHTTKTSGSI